MTEKFRNVPIAIVGMGCLFPKAENQKQYWQTICNYTDAIESIPATHWKPEDYFDQDPKKPDHTYCQKGGFLSEISFDPLEFGIPPTALEATDTSQLLSLVVAKRALEDAGYGENREFDRDKVSIILGVTGALEMVIPLGARLGHPKWRKALESAGVDPHTAEKVIAEIADSYVGWQENSFPGLLGNVVAGRIANRLNLGGTNCVVDAACASSLSAAHMAILELISGTSDMVITGGVDTFNDIFMYMCFSKTPAFSATGNIRPFAQNADGTIIGEGIGMVVLKRLEDAERDGDNIYAVVKSIGTSSDGKSQSVYAPRSEGQAKAIRRAYQEAAVDPKTVELVEAHGTGTAVGDVSEFKALNQVFQEANCGNQKTCGLGSVKSQIGHTKAAAGAAGMIKLAQALHHKVFPPTIKVEQPNPKLKLEETPFYINTQKRPWFGNSDHPRRSGVSSFGFGGSNFHMVIEEYHKNKQQTVWPSDTEIIALSSDNRQELQNSLQNWRQQWQKQENNLAILAQQSRQDFSTQHKYRLVVVHKTSQKLSDALEKAHKMLQSEETNWHLSGVYYGVGEKQPVAFLFPGQGSQYVSMGNDLACCFPEFFETIAEANEGEGLPKRLSDYIYPIPTFSEEEKKQQQLELTQTNVAQPAIGAVSLAMLKLLQKFGMTCDASAGHSYGEIPALHTAGCIDEATLHQLSRLRGSLMAKSTGSEAMMAVSAPLEDITKLLEQHQLNVVLANKNAPSQGVVSGTTEDIDKFQKLCEELQYRTTKLNVSRAFHSSLVADAQQPFRTALDTIEMQPRKLPVFANTTAQMYPEKLEEMRDILGQQLIHSVNFVAMIENLYQSGIRNFVEVGPKSVLSSLVKSTLKKQPHKTIALDSSQGRESGVLDFAKAIGKLASLGYSVDLTIWGDKVDSKKTQKMSVPICGANYRSPQKKKTVAVASKTALATIAPNKTQAEKPVAAATPIKPQAVTPNPIPQPVTAPPVNQESRTMQTQNKPNNPAPVAHNFLTEAFQVMQEAMISMQSMQQHTAQAHHNFLDGQKHAQKTLENMMLNSQRMLETVLSGNTSVATASPATTNFPVPMPTMPTMSTIPTHNYTPPTVTAPIPQPPPAPQPKPVATSVVSAPQQSVPNTAKPSGNDNAKFTQVIISVVSELTGYPEEMLTLEMDLEADLGIDSIKRIEILSSLKQRMPEMEALEPDHMSTLRTMQQMIDYANSTLEQTTTTASAASSTNNFTQVIMSVVSELTGYPEDMLTLEMDLEADLGIDSIKRIEILSSLKQRMSEMEALEPDHMSTLRTMQQMVDYANSVLGQIPATTATVSATSKTNNFTEVIMSVVGELTGYPEDMLTLEMDLEADLGIDSIKRIEILSSLKQRMPEMEALEPDHMSTLRTMQQMVDYANSVLGQTTTTATNNSPSVNDFTKVIMSVVGELTGYPEDMLTLEMDLEADLGIDSIKRIEILSSLKQRMPEMEALEPDHMSTLRTMQQMVEYANSVLGNESSQPAPNSIATVQETTQSSEPVKPVERRVIEVVEKEFVAQQTLDLSKNATVVVVDSDNDSDLGKSLVEELQNNQVSASLHTSVETIPSENIAGLVYVASNRAGKSDWDTEDEAILKNAFACINKVAKQLAKQPNAILATVSRLDGAFGFLAKQQLYAMSGGLAGFVKTAAQEWSQASCRAFDVATQWTDSHAIAQKLVPELLQRGSVEVGFTETKRYELELVTQECQTGDSILQENDVIVVSGGARGVTAQCVYHMAQSRPATYVLLGRSQAPQQEPQWLSSLTQPGEIKKAILQHHFAGKKVSPKELESTYKQLMANREVLSNLEKIQATGATCDYRSVDVCDAPAVNAVISQVREQYQRITGVIHSAGVLADSLLVDKTSQQFDLVFTTKVRGLQTLLQATQQDALRLLVMFSSVSARMGNQGQADYAVANEVLNKVAQNYAFEHPSCRVVSMNWGPWDGGMVTPELKKVFLQRGVDLIGLDAGAQCLLNELVTTENSVEVVLGSSLEHPSEQSSAPQSGATTQKQEMRVAFEREISVSQYPILKSHIIGGKPVVPVALIMEWLGHGALHHNPGLHLCGYEDLRVLKGIRLEQEPYHIRVMVSKAEKREKSFVAHVQVMGESMGQQFLHVQAKAILQGKIPQAPAYRGLSNFHMNGYSRSIEEAYDKILFHGSKLHALQRINGYSENGMIAELSESTSPDKWMQEALRTHWICNPMALDGAFQLAILWCFEKTGKVSLPSYISKYRQYQQRFPVSEVSVVLEVKEVSNYQMKGNFTFLDAENNVVATLEGYECTMDASLYKTFRKSS